MKKVYKINISSESKKRLVIKNTLEYSLLLPEIKPVEKTDENNWIEYAISRTYSSCYKSIFFTANYDFFGSSCAKSEKLYSIFGCTCADEEIEPDSTKFLYYDFFANTIMMQSVMFAYDVIMQALIEENPKPYTLANKIKDKGLNELKDSNLLKKDFSSYNQRIEQRQNSCANAAGYKAKIDTHEKMFKERNVKKFFYINNNMPFSQSVFNFRLINEDVRILKQIFKLYDKNFITEKQSNHKVQATTLAEFHKTMKADLPVDETDRLYYLYKYENVFGLELANHLNTLIKRKMRNKNHVIIGDNELETLANISRFPNVFSRKYYLQFAFDALLSQPNATSNYFEEINRANVMMSRMENQAFSFNRWLGEYDRFCKFFCEFVFPVNEWYFLLTLLETADYYNKKSTDKERLLKLQELLRKYINNNYRRICSPFSGKYDSSKGGFLEYKHFRISESVSLAKYSFDLNITRVLSSFTTACADIQIPESSIHKDFCFSTNSDLKYKRIMGQYISSVINK